MYENSAAIFTMNRRRPSAGASLIRGKTTTMKPTRYTLVYNILRRNFVERSFRVHL